MSLRPYYSWLLKGKILHPLLNLSVSCQSLPPTPGSGMTWLKVSSGAGDTATRCVVAVGLDCACAKSTSRSE